MFIDITDNLKQIDATGQSSFWGRMSSTAQLKTGFSVAGGVIGFIYAISGQRQGVFGYVVLGLVLGAMVGWTSDFVIKQFKDDELTEPKKENTSTTK